MMLRVGKHYGRTELHNEVGGGNRQAYLLTHEKRVLAACLDPKLNPEAPRVILVGGRPNVSAWGQWLAAQKEPIHVFLKDSRGSRNDKGEAQNWVYWGRFTTESSATSQTAISRYDTGKRQVTRLIVLKPVSLSAPIGKEAFVEGACNQVTRDLRERSKGARDACVRVHGYACSVCTMNFQDRYGEMGRDFIHVHHILPMSGKTGEYEIDPIHDLVPVCPNCHAMLHRSPPHSIAELRSIMAERQREAG
jgi:hypothetical protein